MSDLRSDLARAGVSQSQLAQFIGNHGGGSLATVTKTVHREGKTFQQTFHVRGQKQSAGKEPAAASPKVASKTTEPKVEPKPKKARSAAPKNVDEAIKAAGADPVATKRYIDKWVEHSGNGASLSLRSAWAQQAGVKLDETRMASIHAHATGKSDADAKASANAAISQGGSAGVQATAKAIASVSQQAYAGQTHVELHRGVTGEQARLIKEAIARGDKTVKIRVDGAASFTDDRRIATEFAKGKGGSYKGTDATHGAVIKFKAPVSSILASHRAFPTQFDKKEKEVVVASHGVIEIPVGDIETFGK